MSAVARSAKEGGISRACGKAKDGRSRLRCATPWHAAGVGDEESAIRICEPWLRQRDENIRPSDNLFQDGASFLVGCCGVQKDRWGIMGAGLLRRRLRWQTKSAVTSVVGSGLTC